MGPIVLLYLLSHKNGFHCAGSKVQLFPLLLYDLSIIYTQHASLQDKAKWFCYT